MWDDDSDLMVSHPFTAEQEEIKIKEQADLIRELRNYQIQPNLLRRAPEGKIWKFDGKQYVKVPEESKFVGHIKVIDDEVKRWDGEKYISLKKLKGITNKDKIILSDIQIN